MTESEYLEDFVETYGEAYLEQLIADGYTLIRTSRGWRWILASDVPVAPLVSSLVA